MFTANTLSKLPSSLNWNIGNSIITGFLASNNTVFPTCASQWVNDFSELQIYIHTHTHTPLSASLYFFSAYLFELFYLTSIISFALALKPGHSVLTVNLQIFFEYSLKKHAFWAIYYSLSLQYLTLDPHLQFDSLVVSVTGRWQLLCVFSSFCF